MKTSGACFVEAVPERTALVCNVSFAMFFFAYVLVKGGGGRAGLLGIHENVLSDA